MPDDVQVLLDARDFVLDGWCQLTLEDETGNVCAYGALNKAVFGHASINWNDSVAQLPQRQQVMRLAAYVAKQLPLNDWGRGQLVPFNNRSTTTKEMVAGLFDAAARQLKEEQDVI